MLQKDVSGQVSTELILLLAGIIIIVIMATAMYKNYVTDFKSEITDNEVNNLKNKLDELNNIIKGN